MLLLVDPGAYFFRYLTKLGFLDKICEGVVRLPVRSMHDLVH